MLIGTRMNPVRSRPRQMRRITNAGRGGWRQSTVEARSIPEAGQSLALHSFRGRRRVPRDPRIGLAARSERQRGGSRNARMRQ